MVGKFMPRIADEAGDYSSKNPCEEDLSFRKGFAFIKAQVNG